MQSVAGFVCNWCALLFFEAFLTLPGPVKPPFA
jgi:hypothetical protein